MVDGVIGAASRSFNSKQQMQLLDQCKTVVECQLQLLYACKDAGGNGRATEYHANIDEASAALREALNDLLHSSQAAASEAGVVSQIIDSLSRSIAHVDEPLSRDALAHGATYVDCQTRMVRSCKEIARIAQEMLSKSYADASALGPLALDLSRHYAQLADDCRLICTTTNDVHVSARIRTAVQELGTACIEDVKRGGAVRAQPDDQYAKQDLSHSTKIVQEKVRK
jgi:talin